MIPRIFISSVSSELTTARQDVANVLTRLGYDPVWQDIFGTDAGQLKAVLQSKIDDCEGLIHLVGRGYGAEPHEADVNFGRVSYTQFEVLYARKNGKKTWIVFAEEGCTRDKPIEELDLPRDPAHSDPAAYQAERRALQNAWRARLKADGQLRHAAANDPELKLKINELNEEFASLRHRFRRWQKLVLGSSVAILVLLPIVIAVQILQKRDAEVTKKATDQKLEEIKANQEVTAARIKVQLEEASKKALKEELAKAKQEPQFDEREKLKDAAHKAHEMQMERIGDLAARFAELETHADISEDFKEMVRILSTEKVNAVEKALAFAEKGRESRFDRVRQRRKAEQEQNRMELQTDLKAAALAESRGETVKARELYDELLKLDSDWPEALGAVAWFLKSQAWNTRRHGELRDSLVDSERSVTFAEQFYALDQASPESRRVLAAAHELRGEILLTRGLPGDAEQTLKHYTRSLEEREHLMKQKPDSTEAARNVSTNLVNLAEYLARRGLPGDAEQALKHYTRSLRLAEESSKRNPESVEAAQNLSVSLFTTADFLALRGLQGDAEQALKHYMHSLQLTEELLKRNPESAQFERDVSVSLERLGDFLVMRGQSGDAEQALKHYTRNLEEGERAMRRNPQSVQAARDVSISLNKLGKSLAMRGQSGDAEQALKHCTRSLDLVQELLKRNPESAEALRDVSISLINVGDMLAIRGEPGDAEQTLKHYGRSLELAEELLKRNPKSARVARDVFVSLNKLGDLLAVRGQSGDAEQVLKHYSRSLELAEELSRRSPESADAAHDIMVSHYKLGAFEQRMEHFDIAITEFQKGIDALDQMMVKGLNVTNVDQTKRDRAFLEASIASSRDARVALGDWNALLQDDPTLLPTRLSFRFTTLARRGQVADVAQAAAKLRELAASSTKGPEVNQQGGILYNAACAYGLCAGLVVKKGSEQTEAKEVEKKKFLDTSLACLKEAIAGGYENFDHLRSDSDLVALHDLPEFEAIFPTLKPEGK